MEAYTPDLYIKMQARVQENSHTYALLIVLFGRQFSREDCWLIYPGYGLLLPGFPQAYKVAIKRKNARSSA